MKILTILFLAINLSYGQTTISYKDFDPTELKGEYSVVWSADKGLIVGENLILKKHRKFEYEVFSVGSNNGWTNTEKVLTSGKYEIKSDTLKLITKREVVKTKSEIYSFRKKYIIKNVQIVIKSDNKSLPYIFVFLVPLDKLEPFTAEIEKLPKTLSDIALQKFIESDDLLFIGIAREVEKLFWAKRFFLKKGLDRSSQQ
jgi:hypothetical protein